VPRELLIVLLLCFFTGECHGVVPPPLFRAIWDFYYMSPFKKDIWERIYRIRVTQMYANVHSNNHKPVMCPSKRPF